MINSAELIGNGIDRGSSINDKHIQKVYIRINQITDKIPWSCLCIQEARATDKQISDQKKISLTIEILRIVLKMLAKLVFNFSTFLRKSLTTMKI